VSEDAPAQHLDMPSGASPDMGIVREAADQAEPGR
jgi:hypothetical protein